MCGDTRESRLRGCARTAARKNKRLGWGVKKIGAMADNRCFSGGGAGVKMEHFQAALDPRKQELLEARFLGARVSSIYSLKAICLENYVE
ncbi:hypothetical protein JTB14_022110 [Gonioctena quinquepunctata]|nr:hypothetical protein JTB14_022110 [Gonioctena quinquepunctata]